VGSDWEVGVWEGGWRVGGEGVGMGGGYWLWVGVWGLGGVGQMVLEILSIPSKRVNGGIEYKDPRKGYW